MTLLLLAHLLLPDASYLRATAAHEGVPPALLMAVAWEETRANLNPALRGAHGEVGRLQILPATAARWCADLDIRRYGDNVRCGCRLLRGWLWFGGWPEAIRRFNGRGPAALAYRDRVVRTWQHMRAEGT